MKISSAKRHIINAYHKRISAVLWSAPGCGKSSIVREAARDLGIELIDVRLPQLEPTDLRGVPVPNHQTKTTEAYYPTWLPKSGKGILFLDELEKAPISVKNAALELVLDKRIGEYELPKDWSIVSACNREEDGAFSAPIGSALANRMIHLEIEPDYDVWCEWADKNGIDKSIIGYLSFRPEHLCKLEVGTNAFPSPRSWEMLNVMLDGVEDNIERNEIMEAVVGQTVAQEYRSWLNAYRNVDVKAIIEEGIMPKLDDVKKGNEQSFIYAITTAVAHYVNARPSYNGVSGNIAQFLSTLLPEMKVVFTKQVGSLKLIELFRHPELSEIAESLIGIID